MERASEQQRIVVTGMGVISPVGSTVETYWDSLLAGKSGIRGVTRIPADEFPCKVGGEVDDFDASAFMDPKEARRNDRYALFGFAAAKMAMENAGAKAGDFDPDRFGVLIGSGIGGMETIESQAERLIKMGPRKVSPFMIPMLIGNMAAGIVAIEFQARGPNYSIVSACATAGNALGDAIRCLRLGEADVMLAGGSEASITRLGFSGFCNMKAMTTSHAENPQKASRPFDADRDGFVMGEGAGVLVLETLAHAKARGANILAEIAGHAATCDAFHITAPDPEGTGLTHCITKALADAGVEKTDVGYFNAHGTSTPYNDRTESVALKRAFGEHVHQLKVSSTKSMTGHLLGAAGAIEAIATIQTLRTGEIHPTINYETVDPECDLDYVPNTKITHPVDIAMSNNSGFGGHNACLVFRRWEA